MTDAVVEAHRLTKRYGDRISKPSAIALDFMMDSPFNGCAGDLFT